MFFKVLELLNNASKLNGFFFVVICLFLKFIFHKSVSLSYYVFIVYISYCEKTYLILLQHVVHSSYLLHFYNTNYLTITIWIILI